MKYFANTLGFVMFFVPLIFITIILYLIENKMNIHISNSKAAVIFFFFGLLWTIWDLLIRFNTSKAIDKTYFPNFARMEYGGVMVVPIYLSGLLVVFSSLTYNTTILKPGSIAIFVVCLIITVLAEI